MCFDRKYCINFWNGWNIVCIEGPLHRFKLWHMGLLCFDCREIWYDYFFKAFIIRIDIYFLIYLLVLLLLIEFRTIIQTFIVNLYIFNLNWTILLTYIFDKIPEMIRIFTTDKIKKKKKRVQQNLFVFQEIVRIFYCLTGINM